MKCRDVSHCLCLFQGNTMGVIETTWKQQCMKTACFKCTTLINKLPLIVIGYRNYFYIKILTKKKYDKDTSWTCKQNGKLRGNMFEKPNVRPLNAFWNINKEGVSKKAETDENKKWGLCFWYNSSWTLHIWSCSIMYDIFTIWFSFYEIFRAVQ